MNADIVYGDHVGMRQPCHCPRLAANAIVNFVPRHSKRWRPKQLQRYATIQFRIVSCVNDARAPLPDLGHDEVTPQSLAAGEDLTPLQLCDQSRCRVGRRTVDQRGVKVRLSCAGIHGERVVTGPTCIDVIVHSARGFRSQRALDESGKRVAVRAVESARLGTQDMTVVASARRPVSVTLDRDRSILIARPSSPCARSQYRSLARWDDRELR